LNEKKFINIVEEMAIASGISVPLAYVLDNEPAINAFAAGYSPDDAVVTATSGSLNQLNREELQGVAAHEFSHILNGDMRLNIRLVGLISGIMVIGNIGKKLIKHSNRSVRGKMGFGAVLFGLALMIIGYIGVMVSRMIQCAVSRQREFLADASAVQFTRNPMGIAGALKRIGGFNKGSAVISPNAGEISHMFFSSVVKTFFATHPPLKERIRRLDPSFSGEFKDEVIFSPAEEAVMSVGGGFSDQAPVAPENVINRIGVLSGDQAKMAIDLLASIPISLKKELEDPLGACTVIFALLLSKDEAERSRQMEALEKKEKAGAGVAEILKSVAFVEKLDNRSRLTLIDLSMPSLRLMSLDQYEYFKDSVAALISADGNLSLFEFCVQQIIRYRLDANFLSPVKRNVFKSIDPLMMDAAYLLSRIAECGNIGPEKAEKAFDYAIKRIQATGFAHKMDLIKKVPFTKVGVAISKFASGTPGVKQAIFDACAACVFYDRQVTDDEAQILRALAYALDLPMPPFVFKKDNDNR
jgi:hypothetical protein